MPQAVAMYSPFFSPMLRVISFQYRLPFVVFTGVVLGYVGSCVSFNKTKNN